MYMYTYILFSFQLFLLIVFFPFSKCRKGGDVLKDKNVQADREIERQRDMYKISSWVDK